MTDDLHARRVLPDGRVLDVYPLTGGRGRLGVGDGTGYDDEW